MTAATTTAKKQQDNNGSSWFPYIVIPVCFLVTFGLFNIVFGNPKNFVDGDPTKEPIDGNIIGTIYKGGVIVPILQGLLLIVLVFIVERFYTLGRAKGTGNIDQFVKSIKSFLDKGDINGALVACDKQKGSIANVVRAGLEKYNEMETTTDMDTEHKVLAIQKEIEEATTLELPMLEKNLNILATIASVATLLGLLGTVIGMIRAFGALAHAGAPDSTALATGISEALINTAFGIGTSALAIIAYNFFTARIDTMTYRIDEAGYTITQTFAAKH
ncbi:MAG: MotA/TolQ/ExbB proton channel family protein [Saprospiraceae bacterium]